jgi:hypothetical protein
LKRKAVAKVRPFFLTTKFFKNFLQTFFKLLFEAVSNLSIRNSLLRFVRTYFLIADAKVGIIFISANLF